MANAEKTGAEHVWQSEHLRLSGFLTPSNNLNSDGWWESVTGSQPESRTARPSRGEVVEVGNFLDGTLTLSIQPGRIDWTLTPAQAQLEDFDIQIKSVGRFPDIAKLFSAAMDKWLRVCPDLVRLAYGTVLLSPVKDRDAGYALVSRYLPSIKIDSSSRDFMYQINRPRPLEKDGLLINRLSKWSVAAHHRVRMAFSAGSPPEIGSATILSDPESVVYTCRLELDLSTPVQPVELPHDKLPSIFGALVALGSEIAYEGDIP
jgi:hypothetical protein